MTALEALEKIKNIELKHMEAEEDYDWDENLTLSYDEVIDGRICELYENEIKEIEKELKEFEEYKKQRKEVE